MEPATLGDVYRLSLERNPKPDRYLRKRNGAWEPVSSAQLDRDARVPDPNR